MKICEICGLETNSLYSIIAGYEGELLNCGGCIFCKEKFERIIRCFQLDKITSGKLKQIESRG